MAIKILVVDDEPDIREILNFNLRSEGYEIETAASAEEALSLNLNKYDLFLLDIMMGAMSGFALADIIRNDKKIHTPFLFLTAKDQENDMLTGFSLGADDYIKKPFSIVEVKARIKAVLARSRRTAPEKVVELGPLSFNSLRKEVRIDNELVNLTRKEYQILEILINSTGRYIPREEILDQLWQDTFVSDRTVDVHIARLRKGLGDFGSRIKSKSGYGYYIDFEKR